MTEKSTDLADFPVDDIIYLDDDASQAVGLALKLAQEMAQQASQQSARAKALAIRLMQPPNNPYGGWNLAVIAPDQKLALIWMADPDQPPADTDTSIPPDWGNRADNPNE